VFAAEKPREKSLARFTKGVRHGGSLSPRVQTDLTVIVDLGCAHRLLPGRRGSTAAKSSSTTAAEGMSARTAGA
jgi:hypothetical protein